MHRTTIFYYSYLMFSQFSQQLVVGCSPGGRDRWRWQASFHTVEPPTQASELMSSIYNNSLYVNKITGHKRSRAGGRGQRKYRPIDYLSRSKVSEEIHTSTPSRDMLCKVLKFKKYGPVLKSL